MKLIFQYMSRRIRRISLGMAVKILHRRRGSQSRRRYHPRPDGAGPEHPQDAPHCHRRPGPDSSGRLICSLSTK